MTTLPKLSVIIPAFNEASRLPPYLRQVIEYLRARNEPFEIIVVNDGSIDRTAAVVEECQLSTPELRLINLRADPETNGGRTNQGKGNAVRLGVQEARGELVLFADADGSTPIAEVERLEASLAAGTDVAIASRAVQSTETTVRTSWYRKLMGRLLNKVINVCLVPEADTQCGFKLFRREAAAFLFDASKEKRWSFDMEVLFLAHRVGFRVEEVPVNWTNVAGSKVNVWRDGLRMLADIFVFRIRHRGVGAETLQRWRNARAESLPQQHAAAR